MPAKPLRVIRIAKSPEPQSTPPAADPILIDEKAVAALLSVSVGWIRDQTRSGALPSLKIGRFRRYSKQAIVEMVNRLTNQPIPPPST